MFGVDGMSGVGVWNGMEMEDAREAYDEDWGLGSIRWILIVLLMRWDEVCGSWEGMDGWKEV